MIRAENDEAAEESGAEHYKDENDKGCSPEDVKKSEFYAKREKGWDKWNKEG